MTKKSGLAKLQILLVDDEKNIRTTLSVTLSDLGHSVTIASSVSEAIERLKERSIDLVLTDFRLGGPTGLELIKQAKAIHPDVLSIVMTAYASIENAVLVTKEGAFDYLAKPFSNAQLAHLIEKVQTLVALKKENDDLRARSIRLDYFSGCSSPAMRRLERFVNQVAPTDATVLVVGESGTGKSELARIIHDRSPRREMPFVTVDCTTLAESVLESELFGHVRGAFTGATQDRAGKLEQAEAGTLFLDEIGDLSSSAQAKLLRFLQERIIERVGGVQPIKLNTRVIAATNRDLSTLVSEGRFREDLYYRLNMLECALVPIRFRKDDLPVLIRKVLEEAARHQEFREAPRIPDDVKERLLSHSWSGNMRELRNTLERLLILSKGREMEVGDLPQGILRSVQATGKVKLPVKTLEEWEREHIEATLEAEPNFEKAAELLGITSVTLWRKRKQYGLI